MLTEAMSYAQLHLFAEIGLIVFVVVFLGIVIHACCMSRERVEDMAGIPLRDDPTGEDGDRK